MKINYIPAHFSNYCPKRSRYGILYIVLHHTGGSAEENGLYFQGANRKSSTHYFVDGSNIVQSVDDSDSAWHCGGRPQSFHHPLKGLCTNSNSIGVTLCGNAENGQYVFDDRTIGNALELVRGLMEKHSVPSNRVCRHYDVTGKCCPEPWVRHPELWDAFLKQLLPVRR